MPIVPIRQIRPNAEPSQLRPSPLQEVAQAARAVAQGLDAFARERDRLDDIRVQESEVQFRGAVDSLFSGEDGLTTKRGTQAVEAWSGFEDKLRMRASEVEASLSTDRQKALFRRRQEALTLQASNQARRYVDNETRREDAETYTALNTSDMNRVIGDPSVAATVVSEADERVALFGQRNGWSPERVAVARSEMRSNLRLAQVEALAASDPERASEILTDHLDEIAPDKRAKARAFVDAAGMAVRSQTNRDVILAEFGDDEKSALEAVHARFEGAMEDQVSARVQAAYADQRRLLTEDTNRIYNAAAARVMKTGDMGSVDPATIATLTERKPALVTSLERLARQKRTGAAAETDYNVWIPLTNMSADALRSVDPMQYRDVLADREFNILTDMVARANGTGKFAGVEPGLTPAQFESNVFQMAKGDGLLPSNVTSPRQLKGESYTRYTQLKQAVDAEIQGWRQANGDRNPPRSVQLELIQRALDDRVMETAGLAGGFFPESRPRAMVLPNESSRELQGDEVQAANERISNREAQRVRATIRAEIRALVGDAGVNETKVDGILAVMSDTTMTNAQKREAAERIARGQ